MLLKLGPLSNTHKHTLILLFKNSSAFILPGVPWGDHRFPGTWRLNWASVPWSAGSRGMLQEGGRQPASGRAQWPVTPFCRNWPSNHVMPIQKMLVPAFKCDDFSLWGQCHVPTLSQQNVKSLFWPRMAQGRSLFRVPCHPAAYCGLRLFCLGLPAGAPSEEQMHFMSHVPAETWWARPSVALKVPKLFTSLAWAFLSDSTARKINLPKLAVVVLDTGLWWHCPENAGTRTGQRLWRAQPGGLFPRVSGLCPPHYSAANASLLPDFSLQTSAYNHPRHARNRLLLSLGLGFWVHRKGSGVCVNVRNLPRGSCPSFIHKSTLSSFSSWPSKKRIKENKYGIIFSN